MEAMLLAACLIIAFPLVIIWGITWLILCPFWYLGRAIWRHYRETS
jgi:hypothetical protein